jgi:hypothetical protein
VDALRMRDSRAAALSNAPFTYATTQFFIPSTMAKQLVDSLMRDLVQGAGCNYA